MDRKLNPQPNPTAHRQQLPPGRRHSAPVYKMSVSAWVFARQSRFPAVQNARFSYGSCTPPPERGVAPKCSQPGGHFHWVFAPFSLGGTHFPSSRQNKNPCTPPMMRKRGREQRGPARPRTGAAPCGRSFPARFWLTLFGGAGEGAGHQNHGEANDLTRTLNRRPIGSRSRPVAVIPPPRTKMYVSRWSFARQSRISTVQKCTFQARDLPTPTGTRPQVKVFTIHLPQGAGFPRFKAISDLEQP